MISAWVWGSPSHFQVAAPAWSYLGDDASDESLGAGEGFTRLDILRITGRSRTPSRLSSSRVCPTMSASRACSAASPQSLHYAELPVRASLINRRVSI